MIEKSLSRWWLLLGVAALAVAGLFALALVFGRAPDTGNIPLLDDIFHKSLVVHVDLSVLVWFLAFACLMWSMLSAGKPLFPFLEEAALISFGLGALAIIVSPLDPHGAALMSNYIPVIMSPVFFFGLGLIACSVLLMLLKAANGWPGEGYALPPVLRWPLFASACIGAISLMAFIWSFHQMPAGIEGQPRYDLMFWGGGHVLQYVHVQMMMVSWMLMVAALRNGDMRLMRRGGDTLLHIIFSISLVVVLATPVPYLLYNIDSGEHRMFFTNMMIDTAAIAPTILTLFLLPVLWPLRKNALWSALVMSILVFFYGGILGGMIEGQNVVIPAHYHGSIVGITIAFMGAAYLLLPRFGWKDVTGWRLAFWQPILYGGGQMLHITGLAISGGYGVLRKTPGGLEHMSNTVKAAMGIMEIGGLFAIIGGFMFVIVIVLAVWRRRAPA